MPPLGVRAGLTALITCSEASVKRRGGPQDQQPIKYCSENMKLRPMLGYCWTNVEDGGPALTQHWVNDLCSQWTSNSWANSISWVGAAEKRYIYRQINSLGLCQFYKYLLGGGRSHSVAYFNCLIYIWLSLFIVFLLTHRNILQFYSLLYGGPQVTPTLMQGKNSNASLENSYWAQKTFTPNYDLVDFRRVRSCRQEHVQS